MAGIDWSMLFAGITHLGWQNVVMIVIACVMLWVAIAKGAEPLLLVPIAFGVLLRIFLFPGFLLPTKVEC